MSLAIASRRFVPAVVIASAWLACPAGAGVIAGPIVNNGHSYYLLRQSGWGAAERKAMSINAHLATIDSLTEQAWVYNTFTASGTVDRNLWIGLTDLVSEGDLAWADGTPIPSQTQLKSMYFANGQPNGLGSGQDYVHMTAPSFGVAGKWNDSEETNRRKNDPNVPLWSNMYGVVEVVTPVSINSPPTSNDATWKDNSSGRWDDPSRWANGQVPNGVDAIARLSLAVMGTRVVSLPAPQSIGTLVLRDTTGVNSQWILSGIHTLTLATAAAGVRPKIDVQSVWSATDSPRLEVELDGSKGFDKTGPGTLVVAEENPNLTGTINVQFGELRMLRPNGLGSDGADVVVSDKASIELTQTSPDVINKRFVLNGNGNQATLSGALRWTSSSASGGDVTTTLASVNLASPARIGVVDDLGGRLAITTLSGPGDLTKTEVGKLELLATNNQAFTGRVRFAPWSTALNDVAGAIIVAGEGSLGPNPATFQSAQLLLDFGGLIETTTTQTFDDANRGIRIGDGVRPSGQVEGGGFLVASGTTLTVANTVSTSSANSEFRKYGGGELRLTGNLGGFAGILTAFQGTTSLVSSARLEQLEVAGGATVQLVGDAAPTFTGWQIRSILVSPASGSTPAGKLDLQRSGIRIDYDPVLGSPLDELRQLLADGRIGTAVGFKIGIAEANVLGRTEFLGVPVDGTTVLLFRTVGGDTDLNDNVNFNDLLKVAQNYGGATGKTWTDGDFDYDSDVDFNDLLSLAQHYGVSSLATPLPDLSQFSGAFAADWALAQSLVPEPALGLVALGGVTLCRRRR